MMSRTKLDLGLGSSSGMRGSPHAGDDALAAEDLHHLEQARPLGLAADRHAGGVDDRADLDRALLGEAAEDLLDRGVGEVAEAGQPVGENGQVLAALGRTRGACAPSSSKAKSSRKKQSVMGGNSASVLARTL